MKLATLLLAIVFLWMTACDCYAAPAYKGDAKLSLQMESSLNSLLREYAEGDDTDRYKIIFVDLNGDGVNEAVVYARGQGTCGSGGCRTLILRWSGSSWSTVTDISIAKLPIRVLTSKSHGWNDISVVVQGGGIIEPYEAVLRFNGNTYPDNPTMPPAKKAKGIPTGESVLND